MSTDWKQQHANEADKAVGHRLTQDVIAEQLQNLGREGDALARYGLTKIAHYAATVARAQALGFDPDLLTLTPSEGNRVLMERAAAMVFAGKPVIVIATDVSHAPDTPFGCAATWGPEELSQSKDGRLHVCNMQLPHGGSHVCACGRNE